MPVQIDRSLSHLVPCPECVVAQDQVVPVEPDLGIVLHAFPSNSVRGRRRVIVSDDQMLAAIQPSQQFGAVVSPGRHDISQMPNLVVRTDDLIPVSDKGFVVFDHIGERSTIKT